MEVIPTTGHKKARPTTIVTLQAQRGKLFFDKHFDFLNSVPQRRIREIIPASGRKGNSGKLTDYAEGAGWRYSRLEGEVIYGIQVRAAIVSMGNAVLCHSLRRCCPEHGTKVDMTPDVIRSLPEKAGACVPMGGWYTILSFWDACRRRDFCGRSGRFSYFRAIVFYSGEMPGISDVSL